MALLKANTGIGTTNPQAALHVFGNSIYTGIITAQSFSGTATTAITAGYATTSGIATYSGTSGIATYATSSGIATYATTAGLSTYATSSGISTYATRSGIATYASTAGIATVSQGLTGTPNLNVGIVTASKFIGDGSSLTNLPSSGSSSQWVTTSAGIHTLSNVGIGTTQPFYNLEVHGTSFINGALYIDLDAFGPALIIDSTELTQAYSNYSFTAPNLIFKPNFTEKVRITSTGLGIGTDNPKQALEVNGVVGFTTFDYFGEITAKILIGDSETGKSLPANVGNGNILIGVGAGTSLSFHDYNTFIGHRAGSISRSNNNTFIGYYAGYFNTTGSNNVFAGGQAGQANDTGNFNTYLGQSAGQQGYSAAGNVALGLAAGYDNLTGSKNIFLGVYSGESTDASNKIIIGSGDLFGNKFDSPDITKNTQLAIGVRTDSNQSKYWIVGNENFNIGIGTINPTSKLTVGGNVSVSGVVTATAFVGDGSGLTNLPGGGAATASIDLLEVMLFS